jgi:hypothetical protein
MAPRFEADPIEKDGRTIDVEGGIPVEGKDR